MMLRSVSLAAWTAVMAGACGQGTTDVIVAASIELSPDSVTFGTALQTTQLTATVRDQAGAIITDAPLGWSSSHSEVASVSPNGLVTAHSSGSATITAISGTAEGRASITVQLSPAVVLSPTDHCSAAPPHARVTFADTALARIVADTLEMPLDSVTCEAVSGITSLSVGSDSQLRDDIGGLQNLTGLTSLKLAPLGWWLADLSPLSYLTNLRTLWLTPRHVVSEASIELGPLATLTALDSLRIDLFGGMPARKVTDLSPLAGLTGLTYLWLERLGTGDLSPLSGLTSLRTLIVRTTSITDISLLANMGDLTTISFYETAHITDLTPLAGLVNLQSVSFYANLSLSDVSPLLANPGIGAGDFISLQITSVSCADVAALRAKGVTVTHSGLPGDPVCPLLLAARI